MMPDQCPFKSKFRSRSPGGGAASKGGLQAASAWADSSYEYSSPASGSTNTSTMSFSHPPLPSSYSTASPGSHHRATCVWNNISPQCRWKLNSFNRGRNQPAVENVAILRSTKHKPCLNTSLARRLGPGGDEVIRSAYGSDQLIVNKPQKVPPIDLPPRNRIDEE